MNKYSKVIAMLEEERDNLNAIIAYVDAGNVNPDWDEQKKFGYRAWNAGQLKLVEDLLEKVREI